MVPVVSAATGTTTTGWPRSSGRSCCSTEAKKELKSMASARRATAEALGASAVLSNGTWLDVAEQVKHRCLT